ncbi:FkbM family methyltransferase [Deltaproteobacteria bacterium]|nr:FkbM family methyltransferase [Deltaproteobacteria bacterium]
MFSKILLASPKFIVCREQGVAVIATVRIVKPLFIGKVRSYRSLIGITPSKLRSEMFIFKNNDQSIAEIISPSGKIFFWDRVKASIGVAKYVFGLLGEGEQQDKLLKLAALRGENTVMTSRNVVRAGFGLIPTNLDWLDFAGNGDIVSSVERSSADTFKIATSDGLIFHDWESSKKHKTMYWLMRDKAKKFYQPETYFAASAVYRSFVHGTTRFPGDIYIPKDGGTIIEAGAYVGYKAVSFSRQVGLDGRVVAIELNPDNFELLRRNIVDNQLDSITTPVHCAVWNKDGQVPMMSKTRMKNTIVDTDELPLEYSDTAPAKTLDTIIDEYALETVDFLNLQLNGAEIEAIEGLQRNFHKVRYINIISRHHREGELVVDIAKRMLEERGCKIVVDSRAFFGHRNKGLFNLTAKVMK